jgi:glycosyltransferase involved in cell wall biosynthesis
MDYFSGTNTLSHLADVKELISGSRKHAPGITVAIPTYCRDSVVSRTLSAVLSQDRFGARTLFSDNKSVDGTLDSLNSLAALNSDIRIRQNPENIGFWGNILAMIATCETEWLLLCSDEDTPSYREINRLVGELHTDSNHAVIGSVKPRPLKPSTLKRILPDSQSTPLDAYNTQYVSGLIIRVASPHISGILSMLLDQSESNEFFKFYPHRSIFLWFSALGLCRNSSLGVVQRRESAPPRYPGYKPTFALLPSRWNQWLGCLEYLEYLKSNVAHTIENKETLEDVIEAHKSFLFLSINHALRMQSKEFSDSFLAGARTYSEISTNG